MMDVFCININLTDVIYTLNKYFTEISSGELFNSPLVTKIFT